MNVTQKNKKKIGIKKKDYQKAYQQEIKNLLNNESESVIDNNDNNKYKYKWKGDKTIETLFYNYFSEKYKTCIFDLNIYLTHDTEDFIIERIISCVEKIKHCLNLIISKPTQTTHEMNTDIIAIPFGLHLEEGGHRNLLVYRTTTNPPMLEWFEPHGKCFMLDPNNRNAIKFNNIVDDFHRILSSDLNTKIKLVKPEITCPLDLGVQAIEEQCQSLPDNSGGGYCALWSLFFLENVLKFKDMTVTELNQSLLEKYHTSVKLRKLMFSYSKKLSNVLEKQTNMKLNEIIENNGLLYRIDRHLIEKNKLANITNKEKELLVDQIINYFFPEPVIEDDKKTTTPFFNNVSSGTEYYVSENGKSIKSSKTNSKKSLKNMNKSSVHRPNPTPPPCKPDQERNEEGKCVKKCRPDQVRDPITKRCRKIKDGVVKTFSNKDILNNDISNKDILKKEEKKNDLQKPYKCKSDQERNDEGKCVKKCLPNQVRDPITKRCRKIKM